MKADIGFALHGAVLMVLGLFAGKLTRATLIPERSVRPGSNNDRNGE
jgi:hypothetical protein